tara:strand:- start:464 stop:856 length:393 start_codon:yes stop_codon:yes gene_type:complete
MAKDLITEQGMEYTETSLDTQEAIDDFKKKTGHKTVPQIYLDTDQQEYIGGYDDVEKFLLEMVDWRRKQMLMNSGGFGTAATFPNKTVRVDQHKDGSTTVSEEDVIKGYDISITEKKEMKDITPEKNDDR